MAAKNADLATNYKVGRLVVVERKEAQMVIDLATLINYEPTSELLFVLPTSAQGSGGGGGGVTYRMRGYDGDLSRYVYWPSSSVDTAGADYSGNSGALTDVVVQNTIGQV
jgi:hypothetical protein